MYGTTAASVQKNMAEQCYPSLGELSKILNWMAEHTPELIAERAKHVRTQYSEFTLWQAAYYVIHRKWVDHDPTPNPINYRRHLDTFLRVDQCYTAVRVRLPMGKVSLYLSPEDEWKLFLKENYQ